ncbi:MAG: hypothetical protein JNK15_13290 [Planctomycetes bacterium]|nr:hypothetical protein [Planctomycetota bacterium]
MAGVRALLVTLLFALPGAAQGVAWDVPVRGAHVFQRDVETFEVKGPPSRLRVDWVVQDGSGEAPHTWRLFTCPPQGVPAGFEAPQFDDSRWLTGKAEFGGDPQNPQQRTAWTNEVLCLRTQVDFGGKRPKALWFVLDHDDGMRVWLNGKLLVADDGYGRSRSYVVAGPALDAIVSGPNTLAVKCSNVGGVQYLDLALGAVTSLPPGAKTPDDVLKLVREEAEVGNRVRGELFGGYRPPALLLHGELDGKDQAVPIPPGELRDLGWWVAMDLRPSLLGGSYQAEAWRLLRLGDLVLKGKCTAVDVDGWQTIEVAVKNTAEPQLRGDSKRYLDRHVKPFVWYGFDGDLVVRRKLVVGNGTAKVTEFTVALQGNVLRGKDWKEVAATLRLREKWRLAATRANQDAEFRALVTAALQKGTAALRQSLADVGGPDIRRQADDSGDTYHAGRLALGLLALVKGGVPKDDEVVVRGYEELRRRRLVDTYSLANAIMAIEALYVPAREADDLRSGVLAQPSKRVPSPADKALLQKWADQLLTNIDTRHDAAYLLRFNYTGGPRFDNSVNQYGLLGLYSAHLCGIEIKASVWEAAANHLLACQSPEGEKIDLDLVDYTELARRKADPDGTVATKTRGNARALGWSYEEAKDQGELRPTWGSMTAAGITGLAICEAGVLANPEAKRLRLLQDVKRAREDGFAWFAKWMTMRHHAGAIERQQHWFYYYLYSLERAALLSGVALIQGRDWYFEGAMVLVLAQNPDGHWPAELEWDRGIERDAMAILFLKQSTPPVLTGR